MLVDERIIVKNLEEDLYDGQVLQKLLGRFLRQCYECLGGSFGKCLEEEEEKE